MHDEDHPGYDIGLVLRRRTVLDHVDADDVAVDRGAVETRAAHVSFHLAHRVRDFIAGLERFERALDGADGNFVQLDEVFVRFPERHRARELRPIAAVLRGDLDEDHAFLRNLAARGGIRIDLRSLRDNVEAFFDPLAFQQEIDIGHDLPFGLAGLDALDALGERLIDQRGGFLDELRLVAVDRGAELFELRAELGDLHLRERFLDALDPEVGKAVEAVDAHRRAIHSLFAQHLDQAVETTIAQTNVRYPRKFLRAHRLKARFDEQQRRLCFISKEHEYEQSRRCCSSNRAFRRLCFISKEHEYELDIDIGKISKIAKRRAVAAYGA